MSDELHPRSRPDRARHGDRAGHGRAFGLLTETLLDVQVRDEAEVAWSAVCFVVEVLDVSTDEMSVHGPFVDVVTASEWADDFATEFAELVGGETLSMTVRAVQSAV